LDRQMKITNAGNATLVQELERLEKKKRVYEYVRRTLVPLFYHWYVDKIMDTFKDRLSQNLHMLSGRYVVSGIDKKSGIRVYDEWLKVERPIKMLSGGEKTMLGLSFIFALADIVAGSGGSHRVFFIDEGFSALDEERKKDMKSVLENLISSTGHTIFVITHDESILESAPPESPVFRVKKGKIPGGMSSAGAELSRAYTENPITEEIDDMFAL